ncbi:protein FAM133A-like [Chironomus tepperi]|uniref:protein FAM133A-like n=1 Tax=Chironomus tepperi TaxID=113505 RepID=UPI00391F1A32
MLNLKRLALILVISCSCCDSEEVKTTKDQSVSPSDYIYSPLRIYDYPSKQDSYIYFPTDSHYEVLNYHINPEPNKKLKTQEHSVPKYNSKILSPIYYELSSPTPFKKAESQKSVLPPPVRSEKIIVSPNEGLSYKKYESKESSHPKASNTVVKSKNGEVSTLSEGGKKYENSYHKKHGYKTNEDYNTAQKFSKGKKDSYEKKHDSGNENSEKKNKVSDYEDHEQSEDDNHQGHKENGEKYNLKKHHKKGSKAKGYHNVFMKDEYKKDHIIYDNSDERGHFSKHGSDHTKYHKDDYELKKGSHSNSDKESDSSKKQSLTDKKEYDVAEEKYKKESKHKFNDGESQEFKVESGKSGYNVAITHSM